MSAGVKGMCAGDIQEKNLGIGKVVIEDVKELRCIFGNIIW